MGQLSAIFTIGSRGDDNISEYSYAVEALSLMIVDRVQRHPFLVQIPALIRSVVKISPLSNSSRSVELKFSLYPFPYCPARCVLTSWEQAMLGVAVSSAPEPITGHEVAV